MERMKLPPGQRTKEDMSHNILHRRGWAEDMPPIFGTAVDTADIIRNRSTGAAAANVRGPVGLDFVHARGMDFGFTPRN